MRIAGFEIETRVLGPFQENCYRLTHTESGRVALVDPGAAADEEIAELARGIDVILLTHGHLDHIAGIPVARQVSGAPLWAGTGEGAVLADPDLNGTGRWPELYPEPLRLAPPDRELGDDEAFSLPHRGTNEASPFGAGAAGSVGAGGALRALFTPGHEPWHVAFALLDEEGVTRGVLAGDTLFAGSIGRTDLPGGDTRRLIRSIHEKLFALPDDTIVLPGHGPTTTIGSERTHNPFVGESGRFPPPSSAESHR